MKTFLSAIAEDLLQRDINFADTAIIFPNKRASVFFDRELYELLQKPFWSPNYISIQELWQNFSELQIAEPVLLNYRLYQIYRNFAKTEESFDDFYYWGEMLLRDFDDIDKHLVNAKQLFSNIKDIKDLEDATQYLTKEQIDVLSQFFIHFSPEKSSEIKDRFLQIWSVLGDIYERFKTDLQTRNIAYEGMFNRHAVENLQEKGLFNLNFKHYVFVGFNVLNTCEEHLFDLFKKSDKGLFYWDYDKSYIQNSNHEAGIFMRSNLDRYGNALDDAELFNSFENTKEKKKFHYISSYTENAQARYVNQWLEEQKQDENSPTETAVVLCNEQLLIPVLSGIPSASNINITMGYPIKNTPIYSLVNSWINLQINGYRRQEIMDFMEHPYIMPILGEAYLETFKNTYTFYPKPEELHQNDEKLKIIFDLRKKPEDILEGLGQLIHLVVKDSLLKKSEEANIYKDLYQEASFRLLEQVLTLYDLLKTEKIELSKVSFQRLLYQVFSSLTVPFLGEPVLGTQIMGVLETRNLDFKNIIMLSVNEGILPKSANDGSFVPYNLRRAFGMTTIEHKNAVFAYYFFRLMQRAENVSLLYNTATEGTNKGEMSRFMIQMMVENGFRINHQTLTPDNISLQQTRYLFVKGNSEISEFLYQKFNPENTYKSILSPTAINAFINCKLKFYLRYVAGLYAPQEIKCELDAPMLGTLFHRASELLYREIGNQLDVDDNGHFLPINPEITVSADNLKPYLEEKERLRLIDKAFQMDFFKQASSSESNPYSGDLLIRRQMLNDFLKRLITLDIKLNSFKILGLEKKIDYVFNVNGHNVQIGGIIDRLDLVDGQIRIIDYKTGGSKTIQKATQIENLFMEDEKRDPNNLQTLLYGLLIKKADEKSRIRPCILHINSIFSDDYVPDILDTDFDSIQEPFETLLKSTLTDIFSTDTVFSATENEKNCKYCEYLELCRRESSTEF